jgi:hypothetical protein
MLISINIPDDCVCLLKDGQTVEFDVSFLEKKVQTEINIPLAKKIGVPPAKIFRYLKKFVGENIRKGEIIAVKQNLLSSNKYMSDHEGMIKEIDHEEGKIVISVYSGNKNIIQAFFKGQINSVKKDEMILQTSSGHEFDLKQADENFGGEVYYLKEERPDLINSENIQNKILVTQSLSPICQIKAEAVGAKGLVTLKKIAEKSDVPYAQLKNIEDLEKIFDKKLRYCLINERNDKIYFYT